LTFQLSSHKASICPLPQREIPEERLWKLPTHQQIYLPFVNPIILRSLVTWKAVQILNTF